MTNVADAAPVPGQVEPPARTSIRGLLAQTEIDSPALRHAPRARRDPAHVQHPERRQVLPADQHGHAGRPGLGHRDHRHRDGPGHRVAQHRPVGRIARRPHRDDLRAAHDRLDAQHPRHRARTSRSGGSSPSPSASASARLIGALQGFIIAYVGVPSFIVTLGGLLSIRGIVWYLSSGAAVSGLDPNFQLIGGGAQGSIGGTLTWGLGLIGCLAIIALLINGRRQRRRYGFPLRPMWAEVLLGVVGCVAVLGLSAFANANLWPEGLANRIALEQNLGPAPEGGWRIPTGFPYPIVLLIGVDPRHDLDRDAPTVRAVRLRLRRQPRRGRAGRHQHALDDPQDLRPDGHPVRPRRGDRVRATQRRDPRRRPELRALRHRRGGGRRHLVRRRHRDHPGRGAGRLRHAVARLRPELHGRQLARPERRRRHRPDPRRRLRHLQPPARRPERQGGHDL